MRKVVPSVLSLFLLGNCAVAHRLTRVRSRPADMPL